MQPQKERLQGQLAATRGWEGGPDASLLEPPGGSSSANPALIAGLRLEPSGLCCVFWWPRKRTQSRTPTGWFFGLTLRPHLWLVPWVGTPSRHTADLGVSEWVGH